MIEKRVNSSLNIALPTPRNWREEDSAGRHSMLSSLPRKLMRQKRLRIYGGRVSHPPESCPCLTECEGMAWIQAI